MTDDLHGLRIYRASRLEALLEPLTALLDRAKPVDALAPQRVIAAHAGVRDWLLRTLAQQRGSAGVLANLDVLLPSTWFDELAQNVLGESAVALHPYRREALRWRVHEALPTLDDAQVRACLAGDDAPRRRFGLADRIARAYTRYLVYRPDWLHKWATGKHDVPLPSFLAPLWCSLRKQIGLPHRGELLERLIGALRKGDARADDDTPLHLFGISHLAPAELALLRAVARRRLVVLYVPDPCAKYWAGLQRESAARLREYVGRESLPDDADARFLEQDHPLLANLGRIGQHFMLALQHVEDAVRADVRHWRDETPLPLPLTRLQALQESIRHLDLEKLAHGIGQREALNDRSLRVHICHTRLRELEVLRDVLLRELADLPGLKPSEILVTAPDIDVYAPLIAAVFGEAGGAHAGPLPYHLADVALARTHRLFTAFDLLLDLPQSRLGAPAVMDLIEIPEVADALGVDADGVESLRNTIERTRIAWGFDATHRASFGVPAVLENTFAWGVDRLLAGYVFGEGEGTRAARTLPDGVTLLPAEGVAGPQAQVVGALDRLLRELDAFRHDATQPRNASQWAVRLDALIDSLLRIDPTDADARAALAALRRAIHAIESEAGELDPVLEFSVVREVLRERLATVPAQQRFLMGAITFCGMVPQRAVPFRAIAVLGLDDDAFPRAAGDGGIDLMGGHPRLGDRDVRSDDRWLFLETLMSARDVLHLSYVGEGARDGKPRNPAQPLADVMSLLELHGVRTAGEARPTELASSDENSSEAMSPPWLVRHPLQPFSARYFDASDVRLFSFNRDLARLAAGEPGRRAWPFVSRAATAALSGDADVGIAQGPISLREVLAYYKDPAKQLLRSRALLRLDAFDDDKLGSDEPLEAQFARIERVARRVFLEAAARPAPFELPQTAPDWLRLDGLWPPGHVGEQAWDTEREKVFALLAQAETETLFAQGLPAPSLPHIERTFGDLRVQGELMRAYTRDAAWWVFEVYPDRKKEDDLGFKERVGLFLEWALLRLDIAPECRVRLLCLTRDGKGRWQNDIDAWDAAYTAAHERRRGEMRNELGSRVHGLLSFWARAQAQPAWYFPKTSWQLSNADTPDDIDSVWNGGFETKGERDYAPGYARTLARDVDFAMGSDDLRVLHANARSLRTLITLGPSDV